MSAPRLAALAVAALLPAALAVVGCGPHGRAPDGFDPDAVPEAYARSTAALMWPGATRAFQITSAGDLCNGEWTVRILPASRGKTAAAPRAIAFESRWLPVAHWRRVSGEVRWDFEAFALPEPAPRDSGLLVSLEARATNLSGVAQEARIEMDLAPPGPDVPFAAFDAPERPALPLRWGSGGTRDTVYGWSERSSADTMLVRAWSLGPGGSRAVRVVLPAYPTPARTLAR